MKALSLTEPCATLIKEKNRNEKLEKHHTEENYIYMQV